MCNCFQNYFKWYKIKDKTKSIRRNLTCKGANDQLFSLMNTHLSMTLLTFVTKSSGIFVKIRSCKVVTSSNPSSCFNLQQLLIPNSLRWGMVPSSTIHFSNVSSIHSFNIQSSGRPVIHFPLKELPKSLRIFKWRRCPRTSIGSCSSFDADRVRILRFGGNSCSWIALGNCPSRYKSDSFACAVMVPNMRASGRPNSSLNLNLRDWRLVKCEIHSAIASTEVELNVNPNLLTVVNLFKKLYARLLLSM